LDDETARPARGGMDHPVRAGTTRRRGGAARRRPASPSWRPPRSAALIPVRTATAPAVTTSVLPHLENTGPPVGLHRPNSGYEVVLWEVTLGALGRDLTSLTLKDRPVWVLSGKGAATPQGKYDDVTGKGADAWMLGLTPSV
jgi:hypothetical protein